MDSPHRSALQSLFALAPDSSSAEVAVTLRPVLVQDSSDSFASPAPSLSALDLLQLEWVHQQEQEQQQDVFLVASLVEGVALHPSPLP